MAQKNITSYFSHDSNARNDERIVRLRMKHGASGYGVYFMILERLRDDSNYMSLADYNMIAFDLHVDADLVKSVVEDFGLFVFTDDGQYFYSDSFLRRMGTKDEIIQKRRQAASKRWSDTNNASTDDCTCNANAIQRKEIKENNIKKLHLKMEERKSTSPPLNEPKVCQNQYAKSIDEEIALLKVSDIWLESICMRNNLARDRLIDYLNDFALDCDKQHTSLQDAKSHFNRWLIKQINRKPQNESYQDRYERRRGTDPPAGEAKAYSESL